MKMCGVVVPTLGLRELFLRQCLLSVRRYESVHICLVAPESYDCSHLFEANLIDQFVVDTGAGLAGAVNQGIRELPESIKYINWLGDDDLLSPNSLSLTNSYLDFHKDVAMVFGRCDYIDEHSQVIWTNKSGQWAVGLMRVGPCLVPQPGSLFRRDVYEELGGLDISFNWAFDYDYFLRMSKNYKIQYIPETLASFRWHSDSLSVGGRHGSVLEASRVRKLHLPRIVRPISNVWEIPVKFATEFAGYFVNHNVKKLKKNANNDGL